MPFGTGSLWKLFTDPPPPEGRGLRVSLSPTKGGPANDSMTQLNDCQPQKYTQIKFLPLPSEEQLCGKAVQGTSAAPCLFQRLKPLYRGLQPGRRFTDLSKVRVGIRYPTSQRLKGVPWLKLGLGWVKPGTKRNGNCKSKISGLCKILLLPKA